MKTNILAILGLTLLTACGGGGGGAGGASGSGAAATVGGSSNNTTLIPGVDTRFRNSTDPSWHWTIDVYNHFALTYNAGRAVAYNDVPVNAMTTAEFNAAYAQTSSLSLWQYSGVSDNYCPQTINGSAGVGSWDTADLAKCVTYPDGTKEVVIFQDYFLNAGSIDSNAAKLVLQVAREISICKGYRTPVPYLTALHQQNFNVVGPIYNEPSTIMCEAYAGTDKGGCWHSFQDARAIWLDADFPTAAVPASYSTFTAALYKELFTEDRTDVDAEWIASQWFISPGGIWQTATSYHGLGHTLPIVGNWDNAQFGGGNQGCSWAWGLANVAAL